ncbi:MAG: hypothetical protein JNM17_19355 [Archangium sp.]|nr:hypothetical protein [Archangium sp.]
MNGLKRTVLISLVALTLGACAGRQVRQPRMHHAIELLEGALDSLQNATSDKGGHRVKAMEEIRAALVEVRAGIEFDEKH